MLFDYEVENEEGHLIETLKVRATFCGAPGEKPEVDRLLIKVGMRALSEQDVDFYFGPGTFEAIEQYALDNVNPKAEREP